MDLLFILMLVVNLTGFGVLVFKKTKTLPAPEAPKSITASEHSLVKTWIERDGDNVRPGWRARCSCGATSYATNSTERTSTAPATYGNEESAVEAFERHATLFKRANGNEWKAKHNALQAKFDEAQEKCYCKEISPVQLIALRD